MPDEIKKYIDHIKLDNGEKYWLEDAEALKAEGGVITGDLEVQGTTTLDDDVTISGDTIITGSASIAGETSLSGDVLVVGDSTLVGNVNIKEDATVEGDLSVEGNETLTGDFSVDGNTQLTGNVVVDGTTTANDDVSINGDLSVDGETTLTGDTYITGEVSVIGNSTLDGTLTVTNDVIASSDLSVGSNLGVDGASSFNDNVSVTGDVSITGDESITGALSVGGNAVITGNIEAANLAGGEQNQVLTKNSDDDFDFGWVTPITDYNDLTNKPQINDVTLQGNKSLHDLDIQREIKYVELSDGQGILTQEQHDTLFTVRGYTCIVYSDGVSQSILERSGVRGSVFYWTATEINGNQLLTKQIGVDFTTDAWTYTVEEIEEKIDLIEIDTSTLPTTLSQQVYSTLFSSKLNKIVDVAQDNHHTRNRVYSYIDDYWDDANAILYSNYGCTYVDGTTIKRSIIQISRADRSCAAPVDYFLTAGDNISISNNAISFSGLQIIEFSSALSLNFTQEQVTKLKNFKAAVKVTQFTDAPVFLYGSEDSSSVYLYAFKGGNYEQASFTAYRIEINKSTLVGTFGSRYVITSTGALPNGTVAKLDGKNNILDAIPGTDYIAPGDSRLIPSGGLTGQLLGKQSDTDYDADWITPVTDYDELTHRPQINGHVLTGDQTGAELDLQDALTAGDNISITNDVISLDGIIVKNNLTFTQDEIDRILAGASVNYNDIIFTFSTMENSRYVLVSLRNTPSINSTQKVQYIGRISIPALTLVGSYTETLYPWMGSLPDSGQLNKLLKTDNQSDSSRMVVATPGTDYIAPGDNRLIKSGGTEGQVITKNSSTNYDFSWQDLPKGIPDAGTTGQALVKNSDTDYDVKWGTIDTYTQVHCTSSANTPINIKWNDGTSDVTGTMTASQAETNHGPKAVFLVPSSTAGTQAAGEYERSLDGNDIVYLLDVENSTFIKTVTTQFDVEHTHTITPTITTLTAQASGTAVSNTQDTFVKSYPGQSSKMITTQITGTNGTQSVSKVTKSDGSAAVLTETITADGNAINGLQLGTLKFSWTANVPTTLTVTDYDVAKVASSSTTVATGSLDVNAAGASVMTSLGNPTTANALTSSIISTQPTITLNNEPSIDVVTNVTETDSNYSRYNGEYQG